MMYALGRMKDFLHIREIIAQIMIAIVGKLVWDMCLGKRWVRYMNLHRLFVQEHFFRSWRSLLWHVQWQEGGLEDEQNADVRMGTNVVLLCS
jgi:hypothetical protein